MDFATPEVARRKRRRRFLSGGAAFVVVLLVTVGLSQLEPAAPGVERATLWIDTVKEGPMLRQVRGLGSLVPEDIRWIPATTAGRVERIVLRPGTPVEPADIILELSNPALEQELESEVLRLQAAEAAAANLRVQLDQERLQREVDVASIAAEHEKAVLVAEANAQLARQELVSAMIVKQSALDAQQLATRLELARKQLDGLRDSLDSRQAVQQADIEMARALVRLKQQQVDDLRVRAGVHGVLQVVPVDVGQQVTPGTNLARVANPSRLKAEIRVPETQARDVQVGQPALIDTHNGEVAGVVNRIDPSVQNGTVTVDVTLDGELPRGARPDLSVDGTIELERLDRVVYVGRPAFGQEESLVGLFKLQANGEARRVQVRLGRSSVNTVEVLSGLTPGDQVVLSDMSQWDEFDRVRLR
ncbi:MAG: HlyD family efflux transporter periplasmic adaptor subunit [Acidimicrobiia bacterium]|nr:HlyD family efflux transporter periplasmic adaptor subunit [Acidimicrobiia bacterium]